MSAQFTNPFHLGVRVVNLESAMAEIGEAHGLTWASVQERDQQLWTEAGGAIRTPLRFTYSREGPLHIELLQGVPGTIWDGSSAPGVHHTGVWTGDVRGDTEELLQQGWSLVGAQLGPEEAYGAMTYVQSPQGFILELVHEMIKPRFEKWWASGPLE